MFSNKSSKFSYFIELTGVVFYLDFHWNAREQAWYLCIANSSKINLICNIKLVPSYLLLKQYRYIAELPKGELFVTDKQNDLTTAIIGYDSFFDRFALIYSEPGEF